MCVQKNIFIPRFPKTPNYSTDISSAWEIIKELTLPYVIASTEDGDQSWVHFGNEANVVIGDTPEAICKAALLALEVGEKT